MKWGQLPQKLWHQFWVLFQPNLENGWTPKVISAGDFLRIENAATKIKQPITVVGSRARGEAKAFSDWDYVIEGLTHKEWKSLKNFLPGSKSLLDITPRNIDIFEKLDPTKPYITINP